MVNVSLRMMGMGMRQEGNSETLASALNIYMGETQNEVVKEADVGRQEELIICAKSDRVKIEV
ncbi:MAG: hypothetical protein Q9215_001045 [Flavoplaca cf. flavocitrina]